MDCLPNCPPYIPPRKYDVPVDSNNLLLFEDPSTKLLNICSKEIFTNKQKYDNVFYICLIFLLLTLLYKIC